MHRMLKFKGALPLRENVFTHPFSAHRYARSFTYSRADAWIIFVIALVVFLEITAAVFYWHDTRAIVPRPSRMPPWFSIPTLSLCALMIRVRAWYFQKVLRKGLKDIIAQRFHIGPCCGYPLRPLVSTTGSPPDRGAVTCHECGRLWSRSELRRCWPTLIRLHTSPNNVIHELLLWFVLAMMVINQLLP